LLTFSVIQERGRMLLLVTVLDGFTSGNVTVYGITNPR